MWGLIVTKNQVRDRVKREREKEREREEEEDNPLIKNSNRLNPCLSRFCNGI